MEEIINKVAESGLIQMDLADYKPSKNNIVGIDLADQLWEGLVLREKDFRSFLVENDWSEFEDKYVFVHCSADAIVPTWAYMLVTSKLHGIARLVVVGSQVALEKEIIKGTIQQLGLAPFIDGRIIIKGCADITSPEYAMSLLVQHLQPVVKSIMYGEPCSTVPVYKRK
jgi:hypothetical protein